MALFSRMAAISLRFWRIMLSRVTISHPLAATWGIQSVSSTSGRAIRARCPVPLVDDGSRVAGVGDVVAEIAEDLAEPEYVSVDVEADMRRPRGHAAARCDNS